MNHSKLSVICPLLVLLVASSCGDSSPSSQSGSEPSPTRPADFSTSPAPSADTSPRLDQASYLRVTPQQGAVGATVRLEGRECRAPGQPQTRIVFEGHPPDTSGIEGAVQLPDIPTGSDGRFTTTFRVPSRLDPYQGRGGGPTNPGTYYVASRPAGCQALFTVVP